MRVVLDTNVFISAVLGGRLGEFVTPQEEIHVIVADPTDNKFLEAALSGKVDFIVSGDSHLLELGSFREISIITAKEFISWLQSH